MSTQIINCKYCHNTAVVKYGTFEGMQRYFCKSCRRKFADNDALPKMKTPVWVIASALSQYYDGKSLQTIQEYLNKRYGAYYAKSSIYNWVMRFSRDAIALVKDFKPDTGDTYFSCETVFVVGKRKIWLWDIIDAGSGFLLYSHLSENREVYDNNYWVEMIHQRTGKTAKIIITTKPEKNESVSESVWYKSSKDIFKQNYLLQGDSLNTLDRFMATLKTRRAVLRGFKNLKTAHLLVSTWQLHYNFFKTFVTIGHTPPAQSMKNTPCSAWLEVINSANHKNIHHETTLISGIRTKHLPPESLKELPMKGKYR